MTFGRRTTAAGDGVARQATAEPIRTRRGGYWLGLLANAAVAVVTMLVMPFISQFKLNGASLSALVLPAFIALLNLIAIAACWSTFRFGR